LHGGRERNFETIEAFLFAITDRAVGEKGGVAAIRDAAGGGAPMLEI